MERSDLYNFRKDYFKDSLELSACPSNPIDLLLTWLNKALEESDNGSAMVLSTVSEDKRPSSRVVLLRGCDNDGLRFFTSYKSRKGIEISKNPYAAINFFWPQLEKQIRLEGEIVKLSEEESVKYFDSRPEESRINAIISPQSSQIPDRDFLLKRHEKLKEDLVSDSSKLSKPPDWGGYLLKPYQIEFWQGRPGRLHDRVLYYLDNNSWNKKLLAP